jgi:hypothetical protein
MTEVPRSGIGLSQGFYLYTTTQSLRKQTDIRTSISKLFETMAPGLDPKKIGHATRLVLILFTRIRPPLSRSSEFLRPTASRPVRLGIGSPFGAHDQIYLYHLFFQLTITFIIFPMASSLARKWVCSLECLHSLVRSFTTNNHTLPSHPRLCSLFVASYGSLGLRWRYSNPPPHGPLKTKFLLSHI